jgi:DNA polymerase (family 10)
VDNHAIARVLGEIADLLEIKGDNAFKIRAYRSASDTVAGWPDALAGFGQARLRELPGIGKDLAARIRELVETGSCRYHEELLAEFPPTLLDLLRLQGLGPKTVARLYASLNIKSIDELAEAARAGRLRELKGMGARKEAAILKSIEERAKTAGRHLLTDAAATAAAVSDYLGKRHTEVELIAVGSLRRGVETCGDIDILAVGGGEHVMATFAKHPQVERVLGRGDTKSSVLLRGGLQVDVRLVPPESRGAALQYFTGSKAHNIALRDRAVRMGYTLNEYGLFHADDNRRLAGDTEEGVYRALGLDWIAPELRENRGEIEAAAHGALPALIRREDLRGDLHMHTDVTDGRDGLVAMAAAAHRLGYAYVAITDHSQALSMANGLDEHRALEHAAAVRALNGRFEGLTLLAGIECDILADGRLDLADDCLAELDLVIASVHSHFAQEKAQMTDRLLKAIECPWVDVIGHPTGRLLLKREGLRFEWAHVAGRAAAEGVAFEINAQPDRLDLGDMAARDARARGIPLVVSSDAHAVPALSGIKWGVQVARRAWAEPADVLNTLPLDQLRARLRRHRT